MTDPQSQDPGQERVANRANLLPEEEAVGSEDPEGQAEAILEDSDARTEDRDAAPDKFVEHRRSDDVVYPAD
jgi:hypothetical protein